VQEPPPSRLSRARALANAVAPFAAGALLTQVLGSVAAIGDASVVTRVVVGVVVAVALGLIVRWAVARLEAGQTELERANTRFRAAFEETPIGIAVATLDGRFTEVNEALCVMLGRTREQLLGISVFDLTSRDEQAESAEAMRALLAGEIAVRRSERRYRRGDGGEVWCSLRTVLVRDDGGAPSHFVAQVEDVTERRRAAEALAQLADQDPLTGIHNRRAFQTELERFVERGETGAVVVFDLDHFKDINDTLGHGAGDEIVARVARLLGRRLRKTDVLARLGGDEFAAILVGVDRAEALRVTEELLRVVRDQSVLVDPGHPIGLTASAGMVLFEEDCALSAEELIVSADIAMYDAKGGGRDRVAISVEMEERQAQMTERMAWSQRMRIALERDGFVLFQQPVVDLATGLPKSHELLLRMRGDDGELIPPAAFLPIAEQSGLIVEIDRWVTRQAIETLARQLERGSPLRLAVNLSGASVSDPEMLELIERLLEGRHLPRGSLIFEVTETAAIVNIDHARAFAARLAELGCELALDDFGAGFGSFYYLKRLPFDYLKIDGDFIRQLTSSREDQLVVRAIVQIAQGLGKRTVAEFVGDQETLLLLRELGVDDGQGFHLGKPAPLELLLADSEGSVSSRA